MEIYDQLWNDALAAFERGEPQIDPHLSDKTKDLRRGVTLVFRPSQSLRNAVAGFIQPLAAICPGQYFYHPEELHVTVLAVVSGVEHWRREMERVEQGRRIIGEVLKNHRPFPIVFHGVTATPVGVLVQGFPSDNGVLSIRNDIRAAFARSGLANMLDQRYKISGAHMTVMRFRQPHADLNNLISFLKQNRQTPFGECEINNLQFYVADWYSSADTVQMLQEYRLPAPHNPI